MIKTYRKQEPVNPETPNETDSW